MTLRKIKKYSFICILIFITFTTRFCIFPKPRRNTTKKIDKIIIIKHKRKLIVYANNIPLKTYKIALGKVPKGKKRIEGDLKTPEGTYYIDSKNPHSQYYRNLGISYPNREDRAYAKKHGKSAGGLIKIHGLTNGKGFIGSLHRLFDWTKGCIAVTNREIEELYKNVSVGTRIIIKK